MKKVLFLVIFLIATACFGADWITWDLNPPEQQVTRYNVYRGKGSSGNPGDLIGAVFPPAHSFEVTYFIYGGKSQFAVTAVNANGENTQGSNKVTINK